MVDALYHLAWSFGGASVCWTAAGLEVDGAALQATTYWAFSQAKEQAGAQQCLEWLPFIRVVDLRVYNGGTASVSTAVDFQRLHKLGSRVMDVIRWTRHGGGRITVALQAPRGRRIPVVLAEVELLVRVLVSNFPRLLFSRANHNELQIILSAAVHLVATVQTTPTTVLQLATGPRDGHTDYVIRGHRHLEDVAKQELAPNVKVVGVVPHPALGTSESLAAAPGTAVV
ncbi:hypothetical protein PC129_g22940 [Phytophthora cactorum]|uniref:Uncharacterized protein n=1 Tax=Phytophthora cactorum TaxID=29920 RepID=A0A329RE87_9STRA|nr:hypothetical protein PC111_g23227 [Phytophthora cactorum]KAG2830954.1 hypothetical protein PC113_g21013 [Phytophthora cactorum]KAG2875128.1 hypothetical protein PC114_g24906 [Phytophthora cactorum]KAG2886309.1 hypothetical protein PC115_g20720 [Phytophthora cactorum]KAG2887984.1 hypothetical protein PC117_g25035 [Phytophthora cactorum]